MASDTDKPTTAAANGTVPIAATNGIATIMTNGFKAPTPTTTIPQSKTMRLRPYDAASPPLSEVCARLNDQITKFLTRPPRTELLSRVQEQTRISLEVVRRALAEYSFDELAISFNGGKDCLVLLLLFLSSLGTPTIAPTSTVQSVYVMSSHPFAEVDDFVDACVRAYALDLHRYALPMRSAFATYLRENPKIKAVFVGTRRTDPHGEFLGHFDRTDHGWPDFMRVQPVIDWHYQEVWAFLKELEVPYCCLYDMGYTSLGGTTDTHPNPVLQLPEDESGQPRFRPAYELVEDGQERLGRDR